jgi:hypothetical protein
MALSLSSRADELLSLLEAEAPTAGGPRGRTDPHCCRGPDAEVGLAAVSQLRGRPRVAAFVRERHDGKAALPPVDRRSGTSAFPPRARRTVFEHDDAVTALIGALHDPHDHIRQRAIELLARRSSLGFRPARGGR